LSWYIVAARTGLAIAHESDRPPTLAAQSGQAFADPSP
jgi:hypothetical protein